MMNMFSKPVTVAGVILCLALTACGNPEPDQRKEFIAFLQTNILDRKGSHVPQLSGNQKEAFGPYANDYAIITEFATDPDKGRLEALTKLPPLRSMADAIARRDDLIAFKKLNVDRLGSAEERLTKADAAKALLKQPDDLKAVFDKAYQRDVTDVADRDRRGTKVFGDVVDAALRLSDFIVENKGKLEVNGMVVTASDQATLSALQPLLKDFNDKGQAVLTFQQELRSASVIR